MQLEMVVDNFEGRCDFHT